MPDRAFKVISGTINKNVAEKIIKIAKYIESDPRAAALANVP